MPILGIEEVGNMKKWIISIITIIVLFIIGGVIGYNLYSMQNTRETPMDETRLADQPKEEENEQSENKMIAVASVTKKIQPDTIIIIKEYYTKCDHLIQEEQMPKDVLVNMTEDELQAYYKDYKIESFSEREVILYKECKQWCPKHYVLRNSNGVVVIYRLNEQGKEELLEKTDIIVEYLPQEDQTRINEGIVMIGDELLNSTLEDFE